MCVCAQSHKTGHPVLRTSLGVAEAIDGHWALKASLCHGLDLNRKQHCNNHRSFQAIRMKTQLANDAWRGALAQSEPRWHRVTGNQPISSKSTFVVAVFLVVKAIWIRPSFYMGDFGENTVALLIWQLNTSECMLKTVISNTIWMSFFSLVKKYEAHVNGEQDF